jgi:hypothetical protein
MLHLLCMRQVAGDQMRTGIVLAIQRRSKRRRQFCANCLGVCTARAEAAA